MSAARAAETAERFDERPPFEERSPRGVFELLDDSLELYRRRFFLFAGLSAATFFPASLISAFVLSGMYLRIQKQMSGDFSAGFASFLAYSGASLLLIPLFVLARMIAATATAPMVLCLLKGAPARGVDAWRVVVSRLPVLFPLCLICGAALLLGTGCTLQLGNLFLLALWGIAPAILALEKRGAIATLRRAGELGRPQFSRLLGLTATLILLSLFLTWSVSGVAYLIQTLLFPTGNDSERVLRNYSASAAVTALAECLVAPVGAIAMTLQYLDLRIRRDGLDLVHFARRRRVELAPDPLGQNDDLSLFDDNSREDGAAK